ncbi:MAG: 2-oxoacid:acceptor oxidoreductase subunit alpha [Chloroflexota bacterium]|jgi:2-oxoglutarate ferredoxin oxidoreductase subunit alpha
MANPRLLTGVHLMQGQQACAEGALAAGCNLFAGYPISPATEIAEAMARRLPQAGGIYVQGADELDSLTIVIGSVWGGFKSMTATSGNGICLMQENIGYAAMTETPCVIVDMMRAGPGTGIATKSAQGDIYQVRFGSNGDYSVIALAPESPQEMFDLTVEAFNLAEEYRTPVFILGDEILSNLREKVVIPAEVKVAERRKPAEPPSPSFKTWAVPAGEWVGPMPAFGQGYRLAVSSFARTADGSPSQAYSVQKELVNRLWNKVEANSDKLTRVEDGYLEDAEVLVIGFGSVARSVKAAVRQARAEGLKVGFSRLIGIWPFPDQYVKRIGKTVKKVIVAEMNMGRVYREVQRCLGADAEVVLFSKPGVDMHTPAEIVDEIRKVI